MASVHKPAGRRIYRIKFIDQHGQQRIVSSDMTDRRAAEGLGALIEKDVDRIRADLPPERPDITGPFLGLEVIAPQHLPWAQVVDMYLADLTRQGMSPLTIKNRKSQLHILARLGVWKNLHHVTTHSITATLAAEARDGRARTCNVHRDNLHAFLEWCVAQGFLQTNPVRKVKRAKTTAAALPRRKRPFTAEELRRLLDANPASRDYYRTAALTGLRWTELSRVERRDFDLEKRVWTCRAEIDKTRMTHRLPILPDLLPTLQRVCDGKKPTERLFPRRQTRATFQRNLRRAKIARFSEDGRRLSFHSLRYTFCTLLAQKLPLKAVQRLMRHASLKRTADLYLQLGLDSLIDLVIEAPAVFPEQVPLLGPEQPPGEGPTPQSPTP